MNLVDFVVVEYHLEHLWSSLNPQSNMNRYWEDSAVDLQLNKQIMNKTTELQFPLETKQLSITTNLTDSVMKVAFEMIAVETIVFELVDNRQVECSKLPVEVMKDTPESVEASGNLVVVDAFERDHP